MPKVNVLGELLEWSKERPLWQRDALRRMVTTGGLDEEDLREIANICKSEHGLGERTKAIPLDSTHISHSAKSRKTVSLDSLTHHSGVNALAPEQTIAFGPGLTIVFGANAAGKSGYTRILKRACRARGSEEILGNVVSGAAPGRPNATIRYTVDNSTHDALWDDSTTPNPNLAGVSVFDRHCASVYLSEQTDVAFRPMGLDLFDKLSKASEDVRRLLEQERRSLAAQTFRFPQVAHGTSVHDLVNSLTSLTNVQEVKELGSLTADDRAQMKLLQAQIQDLRSESPRRKAREIDLRARRAEVLLEAIRACEEELGERSMADLLAARTQVRSTCDAAQELRKQTFATQPLAETGSEAWRTLWDAAERYSQMHAYPNHGFPFLDEDARCVLCQQYLSEDGRERLAGFQAFLRSSLQQDHERASLSCEEKVRRIQNMTIQDDAVKESIEEMELDDPELAAIVRAYLKVAEDRRAGVLDLVLGSGQCSNLPAGSIDLWSIERYVEGLRGRRQTLLAGNPVVMTDELESALQELESRNVLGEHLEEVLNEIERKKEVAAYQLCISETKTNAITRKSSDVTKRAVTERLTTSFREELNSLRFQHVEVEMVAAGGSRGALYHKLQLRRAPGVQVPRIVSEGEARCLSVASFFAELSTDADRSAILFDDPVSSLDHNWRDSVAERLVRESTSRQVIVFTHDVVFLVALSEQAKSQRASVTHQYLRRDVAAAGLASKELPWIAMKVKDRIGRLKELWQNADKKHRVGEQESYEEDASRIYGFLRTAWERGVEEVLLGGAVERYRSSVQTLRVRHLSDITDEDCVRLEAGMTKCSKCFLGHDQSPADSAPLPPPNEVLEDIKALEDWVKAIQSRRR